MIPEIFEVDYGLASRYEEGIEINRKLAGELREKVLKHEAKHTQGGYRLQDYKNDFHSKDPYFLESLKFCFKNPEAFVGFFPFMYSYHFKTWTFNTTALFPYALWGVIFSLMAKFLIGTTFFYAFLTWSWIFIVLNAFLVFYTHLYVKYKFQNLKGLFTTIYVQTRIKVVNIKTRIISKFRKVE